MSVVFAIVVQLPPELVEYSQRTMLPVYPTRNNVPLLEPEQTEALLETVPPTEIGEIVIVAGMELEEAQIPLCTTALYSVVVVIFE